MILNLKSYSLTEDQIDGIPKHVADILNFTFYASIDFYRRFKRMWFVNIGQMFKGF